MAHYTDWPEYPTDLLDVVDYPTQTDDVDYVQAWLINSLVHEMIAVQKELGTLPKGASADVKTRIGALSSGYISRGDPTGWDWLLNSFTTDGTWRDLDISSIVPAGTTVVNLIYAIKDNLIGQEFMIRKKGQSQNLNRIMATTQVANLLFYSEGIIQCDANRKIQYLATNTTWTGIYLTVKGWWK